MYSMLSSSVLSNKNFTLKFGKFLEAYKAAYGKHTSDEIVQPDSTTPTVEVALPTTDSTQSEDAAQPAPTTTTPVADAGGDSSETSAPVTTTDSTTQAPTTSTSLTPDTTVPATGDTTVSVDASGTVEPAPSATDTLLSAPIVSTDPITAPSTDTVTIFVSSAAQLQSALKAITPGGEIKLAAGDYGDVVINGAKFSSDIKITSADADHPATFNTIKVLDSSGITFDHVSVNFTPDASTMSWSNAVYIFQSSGIDIVNSTLTGGPAVNGVPASSTTLDSTGNVLGMPAGRGIFVFRSQDVTIANNDIQTFHKGVLLNNADGVTIHGNEIHGLRTTPISGSNLTDLTITKNYLHDSNPWNFSAAGDHGDFIHLWNDPVASQSEVNRGITIENNYIDQGNGFAMLGIFLNDYHGLGYEDVSIQNNVVKNNNAQAIRLENVDGVVSGNSLVQSSVTTVLDNPHLSILKGSNVVASNNVLSSIIVDSLSYAVQTDNVFTTNGVVDSSYVWSADTILAGGATVVEGLKSAALSVTDLDFSAVIHDGTSGADVLNDRGIFSTMSGFAGNDQYIVTNEHTTVIEQANAGTDGVQASFDYTLSANIENLMLTGTARIGQGNELDNQLRGNAADNVLYGHGGNDMVLGGDGADTLYGGDGNDRLHGEAGGDHLEGGVGNDWLSGYAGNDRLIGGDGNDELLGGLDNDTLTGGTGADKFTFAKGDFLGGTAKDWITDFSRAEGDRISLAGIDAKPGTTADDPFSFIGTAAFTGKGGELRYEIVGSDTYIYGDTNGDRVADVTIGLTGPIALNAGDFFM